MGTVIWRSTAIQHVNFKPLSGKIAVGGELSLFLIYKEDISGRTNWYETTMPFSGNIECQGCEEMMTADIAYEVGHEAVSYTHLYGAEGVHWSTEAETFTINAVSYTHLDVYKRQILEQAFVKAASIGVPVSLHEENPALISNNGVNSDIAQKKFGIGGSPREAEIDLIARDLDIA